MNGVRVVVGIPCFNTEPSIGDVVAEARKYVDQVIVIDDGSHDGTTHVAKAAGALVVNHRVNRGYGEAINSCVETARANGADVLVILDGDGQHNPEEIPKLLVPILKGDADLVIGSRFLVKEVNMPAYRRFGISVITWLFNFGSRTKVSDTQSGFRAYSKKLFGVFPLRESGMSVSIESLEKARLFKAKIKEVPITCVYLHSNFGRKAVKHGITVAWSVLRIRLGSRLSNHTSPAA